MAIAITLLGFNDLGRSVTPIFLSMGHFLYRFSIFCEKMKKIYRVEVCKFFLQNAPSKKSVPLTSSFSCVAVSNASSRVKVCENEDNI